MDLVTNIKGFFYDELGKAISNQRAGIKEETRAYLVVLLSDFASAHNKPMSDKPMALILKDALDKPRHESLPVLRYLGDLTLFTSGFFQESLSMSVDYYAEMGGRAYGALGSSMTRGTDLARRQQVFQELSCSFMKLVKVLEEISDRATSQTEPGLVRLYDKFLKNRSAGLCLMLREKNVNVPVPIMSRTKASG